MCYLRMFENGKNSKKNFRSKIDFFKISVAHKGHKCGPVSPPYIPMIWMVNGVFFQPFYVYRLKEDDEVAVDKHEYKKQVVQKD